MKTVFLLLLMIASISAAPVFAGQSEYDDCILKYMQGAHLDVTAQLIRQACEDIHQTAGLTAEKRRAYNQCLLEYLPGIENIQAAMDVKAACSSKYL